jgi:hypothetical protein
MRSARRHLLALGLVVLAGPLQAQDAPRPAEIHGFGGWTYGRSTDNHFLAGTPEGDYHSLWMAINVSKRLDDKLSIHTQGEFRETQNDETAELDYAFAEYKLSDQLLFRVGQVKNPFGIYTEVFDVGTLRPFIDLPQGVYGPAGFAGEAYRGIGVSGTADVGAWAVGYDVYGGGDDLRKAEVPEHFYAGSTLQVGTAQFETQSTRNVIGGRVVLKTPIRGLSFGGSSYTGTIDDSTSTRRTIIAGQIGYRTNVLTLESEVAHQSQVRDEQATGGYVLAALRLTPEWQVAAHYDKLSTAYYRANVTAAPSLQYHRESAFAVSRWMTRAFVLKAEYHRVSGNRLAMPRPDALIAAVAANELRVITHLFQFGAQYSF